MNQTTNTYNNNINIKNNNNNYHINISENDLLELDDHSLYLKIWWNLTENKKVNNVEDLKNEITRAINIARNREICQNCYGTGFSYRESKCLACNGRGFHLY